MIASGKNSDCVGFRFLCLSGKNAGQFGSVCICHTNHPYPDISLTSCDRFYSSPA